MSRKKSDAPARDTSHEIPSYVASLTMPPDLVAAMSRAVRLALADAHAAVSHLRKHVEETSCRACKDRLSAWMQEAQKQHSLGRILELQGTGLHAVPPPKDTFQHAVKSYCGSVRAISEANLVAMLAWADALGTLHTFGGWLKAQRPDLAEDIHAAMEFFQELEGIILASQDDSPDDSQDDDTPNPTHAAPAILQ